MRAACKYGDEPDGEALAEVNVDVNRRVAPPGTVLVRVRAHDAGWVEQLPHVPPPETVTTTVSAATLEPATAPPGYVVVGRHRPGAGDPLGSVDLLVTGRQRDAHPDWWHAVVEIADQIFDLELGPVQVVFGNEIAQHLAARRRTPH